MINPNNILRNCGIRKRNKVTLRSPVLYHGTDKLKGHFIKREGIKTVKRLQEENERVSSMSDKTDPNYTYFFEEKGNAQVWADIAEKQSGIKSEVFEADVPDDKLERDYDMPFGGAYKYKGSIPPERVTSTVRQRKHIRGNKHGWNSKSRLINRTKFNKCI